MDDEKVMSQSELLLFVSLNVIAVLLIGISLGATVAHSLGGYNRFPVFFFIGSAIAVINIALYSKMYNQLLKKLK